MRATSIIHDECGSNYQSDFNGPMSGMIIKQFEQHCVTHNAAWGKLFDETDGTLLVSYCIANGLKSEMEGI